MKASLLLGACSLAGLTLGVVGPALPHTAVVTVAALALQTCLTVGALPRLRGDLRAPSILIVLHLFTTTAVLALIAWCLGIHNALGLGALLLAVVPPAAGLPAYADVSGADVATVTHFSLASYVLSLVATPVATLLLLGHAISGSALAISLAGGLFVPTLVGRLATRRIRRIDPGRRRAVVAALLALVTYTVGNGVAPSLGHLAGPSVLVLALLIALARTTGSGLLAGRLYRRHVAEAMLVGGFKNAALAAAMAVVIARPLAALPAMLSFPCESLWLVLVARRARRADSAVRQDCAGGRNTSDMSRANAT